MSKTEKDYAAFVDFSEQAKERGWKVSSIAIRVNRDTTVGTILDAITKHDLQIVGDIRLVELSPISEIYKDPTQ